MEPWKQAEVAYENAIAASYDALYYGSPIPASHLDKFIRLIRRHAKRQDLVLDLGGGTGIVTERLLAKGYRRVITADLSLAMLREAKKKTPNMIAIACDGEHLPFKDDVFQTIVCSSVLHHLPYPDRVLRDARRAMTLYGVLIAQEPNQNHFLTRPGHERVNSMCTAIMHYFYRIEQYQPAAEPPVHEYHRAFTKQQLLELFLSQLYILEFRSHFAFSSLFTKIRSPFLSRIIRALDGCLSKQEGSVFHLVCSKTDWGHRNILRDYFQYLEQLRADQNQRVSGLFIVGLLSLIAAGRLYELYERVRARLQESA